MTQKSTALTLTGIHSGADMFAQVQDALNALYTRQAGTSDPNSITGAVQAHGTWYDTTNGVIWRRNAGNTAWLLEGGAQATKVLARSSNAVLTVSNAQQTIIATGTFTQTFNAVATLNDGWYVIYRNDGAGVITLDPNAAETIDGAVSIQLAPGESCIIYSDGTQLKTVGRAAPLAQNQTTTAFTAGGTAPAFALTPVPAITAYAANQRFRVKFNAAGTTGSNTLNISGLGVKNLMQYDATGAKVSGVVGNGQLCDVEYDGTDFVILDPLPSTAGYAVTVRQTVIGGPVDSNGFPSFLPATSGSLSITSQNITSTAPFVVAAANGFGANGNVDRVGISIADLTWSGLAPNAINSLYVDVNSNGTLTTVSNALSPVYQQGGARSAVNGQSTFNISEMSMTVGNGTTAVQTYRVCVGEATTNANTVTSTVAYAYQGYYDSGYTNTVPASTVLSKNHNIGTPNSTTKFWLKNILDQGGYVSGDESDGYVQDINTYMTTVSFVVSKKSVQFVTSATYFGGLAHKTSPNTIVNLTPANWAYRFICKRGF